MRSTNHSQGRLTDRLRSGLRIAVLMAAPVVASGGVLGCSSSGGSADLAGLLIAPVVLADSAISGRPLDSYGKGEPLKSKLLDDLMSGGGEAHVKVLPAGPAPSPVTRRERKPSADTPALAPASKPARSHSIRSASTATGERATASIDEQQRTAVRLGLDLVNPLKSEGDVDKSMKALERAFGK